MLASTGQFNTIGKWFWIMAVSFSEETVLQLDPRPVMNFNIMNPMR